MMEREQKKSRQWTQELTAGKDEQKRSDETDEGLQKERVRHRDSAWSQIILSLSAEDNHGSHREPMCLGL